MKAGITWVAIRTAIYATLAVIAVTGGGYLYSAATGTDVLAGSRWSERNLIAWLHIGAGVAAVGGCIALVLLSMIAPFRYRLMGIQIKLLLLPFFLLPVLFIDLVGSSPSFTLGIAGIQLLYLTIVPMAAGSR